MNDIRDLIQSYNHLEVYRLIHSNLAPLVLSQKTEETKPLSALEPVECKTWKDLCDHWKKNFFFTKQIEETLAVVSAVVLSTTTEGGQLALRVLGPPGAAKSTIAECFAEIPDLVHPISKFTGIVSGWGSVTNDQQLASKLNGKCLMVKDADPLMQMTNLHEIEAELRDGLGDAVIRATYKTGRELEIRTLFTCILFGTKSLKGMDNTLLGARYLDVTIHDRNTPTRGIVKHAIKSQGVSIIDQLTRNLENGQNDNKRTSNDNGSTIINASCNRNDPISNTETKRKPIIVKLAPKTIGFIQHKKKYIDSGKVDIKYPNAVQEERIYAMGELISFLRAKPDRTKTGDLKYRIEKELSTRLGELLIRLYLFLQIVINDHE